jgi:hypothetical protein
MIVLTADQRGSTRHGDRVPEGLALLAACTAGRAGLVLPFDRTVGDEVQGLLDGGPDGAALALDATLALLRDGRWTVGLGAGAVDEPLPAASRAASGGAFVHARHAVERAKGRGSAAPVAVEADDPAAAAEVEALLRLLGAVAARRSPAGWEAVDTLAAAGGAGSQKDVARALGITEQAVSQRLRAALWAEEAAVRPVVVRLLVALAGGGAPRAADGAGRGATGGAGA